MNETIRKYGQYVIWMEESEQWDRKAMEDVNMFGRIILSDFKKSEHWGDDWNDSPASCNAGSPYDKDGDHRRTLEITPDTKLYTVDDVVFLVMEIYRYLKGIN